MPSGYKGALPTQRTSHVGPKRNEQGSLSARRSGRFCIMPIARSAARSRIAASLAVATALALLAFPGVASAVVTSSVGAGVLTVDGEADDAIAITCDANDVQVNGADPDDGQADCDSIESILVTGGDGANAITLTGVTVAAFPAVISVDVEGGAGDDTITGSDIDDDLFGGGDDDRIIGGKNPAGTRDNAVGGDGDDTLVWNPGDGDDINEGGAGIDTIEVNGGGGGEQFTVKPSATAGRVAFDRTGPTPPGPFNLDIGTAERLVLNAGAGDDRITGANGLAGLISSTFNGDDGNDRITGTDGADRLFGGKGNDVIRSRDKRADRVSCGAGFDIARVDRRDRVSGCEVVLGGRLRVRLIGKTANVTRGRAALRLRCVATRRCSGTVRLLRGGRRLGSVRFKATRRRAKTVRVRLNRRGRRLVARAPRRGVRITAQINARDGAGNGWRTTTRVRLRR